MHLNTHEHRLLVIEDNQKLGWIRWWMHWVLKLLKDVRRVLSEIFKWVFTEATWNQGNLQESSA